MTLRMCWRVLGSSVKSPNVVSCGRQCLTYLSMLPADILPNSFINKYIFFLLKRGSSATMEIQQMLTSRMTDLRSELRNLEQKETFLDLQKFWVEESIKNTTEDCSAYPFSNSAESRSCCLVFCYVEWGQKVFHYYALFSF